VECRIGNAIYPSHYDIGWHITATTGVFGAAAAAGRALGLNGRQMSWAIGIAATQSSGLREMFGTMCKPFHPGRAAQNGLIAAFLAQRNYTSSERAIEAPRGFAHVLATERNLDEITRGLGETWEISLNTYKPFACGIVIHPTIDGCIQLRNEHNLRGDAIDAIVLTVHPLVLELTGTSRPRTGLEGKFSVHHSAAIAILEGAAGESQYSDTAVRDPRIVTLRDRVRVTPDKGLGEDEAHIEIRMKDGRVVERHVDHAVGSLARPMSDAALDEKFHGLCRTVLSHDETEHYWSCVVPWKRSQMQASLPGHPCRPFFH
jgi:2-methylcitrate dehydratase PrpD